MNKFLKTYFFRESEDPNVTTSSSIQLDGRKHPQSEKLHRNYFNDKQRKIDFILVCSSNALDSVEHRTNIMKYIAYLQNNGLQFETEAGMFFNNDFFIKVHGPNEVLLRYAKAFNVPLEFQSQRIYIEQKNYWTFLHTRIMRPDPDDPIFNRAKETLSGERPTKITEIERIMIVHMLLSRAVFGDKCNEHGIEKLKQRGTFIAAYPLHSGQWEWTVRGPLNDRQLLARYWARLKKWYRLQPLSVVEKYYGPEVAFYFAFLGFYNKMLIPASIVGFLCFVFGFKAAIRINKHPIEEICKSKKLLCPIMFKGNWEFRPLRSYCSRGKMTYMFDNNATLVFAFFMVFWATTFMVLWKREHTLLMSRWNLTPKEEDLSWRREYEENTKYRRICPITGMSEPYVPLWIRAYNYFITCITCTFLILIVLLAVFLTIMYRLMLSPYITASIVLMIMAAIISVIFIKFFGKWYGRISLWLTIRENPRTQAEFDNSYIYKLFILQFVNNYAAMSYMAFVKGKLYTYPGDMEESSFFSVIIKGDLCHPAGCIMGLSIQLAFIMFLKSLSGNILTLFKPQWKKLRRIYVTKEEAIPPTSAQWELDYDLQEMGYYFLVDEYMEMIMQYGFVTFFVAAFPLAPLFAFVNNVLQIRTNACKFVKYYRRPVPVRINGLQGWIGILQAMTFISMATNAFVIAFTSDYVKRLIYMNAHDVSLRGFIDSTLSEFDVDEFKSDSHREMAALNRTCYYRGDRYPPEHHNRYERTANYWYELSIRFLVAVIFEHIMLIISGVLSYAISDMSYSIKKQIKYHHNIVKRDRLRAADDFVNDKQSQLKNLFPPMD
ncbi:hypothetical protein ILUMI_03902 [Ignelater luminosus]|uniref:Anoctamin n=1 Tax=Ignelater luminosus TaxID=2038154 RepID=A0A8K0GK19_IGNLU|nr:hypothetical protein ILUMI_03902 [Ignelater luminosus]